MRFLIELGRRIHFWWFRRPTTKEYAEWIELHSVQCKLCRSVQLDEVCIDCKVEAWVQANPDFNN